jgi:hypothetical protein
LSEVFKGKGQLSTVVSDPINDKTSVSPGAVLSSSQVNALGESVFLALNLGSPKPPLPIAILDDPLQSLDDINLLGLVDLLRRTKDIRLTVHLCLVCYSLLTFPNGVDGTLTRLNGDVSVTTPFTSPAVITSGDEFSGVLHSTDFSETFDVAVDFSANGFTVAITSPSGTANLIAVSGDLYGITLSSLPSFVEGFTLTGYACNAGVNDVCPNPPFDVSGLTSNTFSSSAVTLDFSTLANGQTYTFTDVTPPAATPEPSSLALLGTGVLAAAGVIRRRLVRS